MQTVEHVLDTFVSECLDGRDAVRLSRFVPEADLDKIAVRLKDEFVGTHEAVEWTRDNILTQLRGDVAFGFEKALDQRGLSAGLMYSVVQMWNRILEDGLERFDSYAQYGLPLFKATAVKYGWPNPIGDDTGSEFKYAD
jgi:hypothetical protein